MATVTEFGERIGVAFQLSDDVIDIASDADDSGKTPGTDLREGVPTLPTLLARRSTSAADADLVRALSAPITDDAEVAQVLAALRQHPAMDEARAYVQAEADSARGAAEQPAGRRTHRRPPRSLRPTRLPRHLTALRRDGFDGLAQQAAMAA